MYLWVLCGSGVRETLRMGRLLWEGDCCLWPRACCGEPEWGKRPWGLADPRDGCWWPRLAGEGESRESLGGRDGPGEPLRWRGGGDMEEGGGVRRFCPGLPPRRLGERELGRRLAPGEGDALRLGGGEPDGLRFCCTGEGL